MRYFTSDWHLNSNNIIKYANRPFSCAGDAANKLVDNCNAVAKWKNDVVFHVGDFWKKGVDRHDKKLGADEAQLPAYPDDYINGFIHARFILMSGNHDDGHNLETEIKSMMIDLNQNYKDVFVTHFPSDNPMYRGRSCSNWSFGRGINLCGHVHDKWLLHYDHDKNILNINVGVDVWDYKPVRDAELTELFDFMSKLDIYKRTWSWTRDDLNMYQRAVKIQTDLARTARKNERYAKKGLTPEECERRKRDAMQKKGLI